MKSVDSMENNESSATGWSVYILECADGTLYTGITNDLSRRLAAHQQGTAARYTRSRLPVALQYRELHPDRSSALRREAELKRLPREEKLCLIAEAEDTPSRLDPTGARPTRAPKDAARSTAQKSQSGRGTGRRRT